MSERRLRMQAMLGVAAMIVACSSNENGGGSGNDGGSAGIGGGGGGPSPCDHVLAADQDLLFGFGAALALDERNQVFLLRDAGTTRKVQALANGALTDVAALADEPTVYKGGSNLVVSPDGFFFDATVGGARGIYVVPRSGGAAALVAPLGPDSESLAPPFLGDSAYLYKRGLAPSNDSFDRIAQRMGDGGVSTAVVGAGAFAAASAYAIVSFNDTLFTISGSAEVRVTAKTPADPDGGVASAKVGVFNLPACSPDLGSTVAVNGDGLFIGCVAADVGRHTIYQVPPPDEWLEASAAPDASATAPATEVVSGNSINTTAFLVDGTNLYYANEADPALFRMPDSGGAKTKIMATHGVKRMVATSTDIYVLSACGLQQAPL